jgi:hypothetical protein
VSSGRFALASIALVSAAAAIAVAQALPTITEDAPPIAVQVPAMPTLPLTIDAAGEYEIEATTVAGDAQLFLLQGETVAAEDTTSIGSDAHIVVFLEPGRYGVRVRDSLGNAMTARMSARRLAPLPIAATIAAGDAAVSVTMPQGGSIREASAEVTLHVTTAGTYRIDARSPDADHDAELQLIREGVLLQADGDGGEGTDAQIVRALEPGDYTIRVHDYANRGGTLTVQAVAQ